ncbi:MAG: cysteine desulfurase [Methylococcaceae bacterium]|nr:cysteine desulfurase [Methylococcaceae bacterium]
MLYFDHNATTPLDNRVLEAMLPFLQHLYGNASALYRLGRVSRSALETARTQVAQLVGVQAEQVIFTSGGTEANNLALQQVSFGKRLAVSAIEHPSIMVPALLWQAQGQQLNIIDVDAEGHIKPDFIERVSWAKGDLVSMQMAHNETGVLQDIVGYAELLREKAVTVHTDAVQAAGKIPVDFVQARVHLMTLSSHKIYGPKGCGALIVENGFNIRPLIQGGGQEQGWRSGTENVAGLVGFGKAAELALTELVPRQQHLLALRMQLEQGLKSIPGVVIFSEQAERLPNTVQWGLNGLDGEMLLMQLDRKGIAVSSGSACASGGNKPSAGLTAMGISEALAKSALRISLGQQNTTEDINTLISTLKSLVLH